MVFPSRRKTILIHGCFWHQHDDARCRIVREPKSNQAYWVPKLERNKERDHNHQSAMTLLGWESLVVWECEVEGDIGALGQRIRDFLG